jgi:hypothetical protein
MVVQRLHAALARTHQQGLTTLCIFGKGSHPKNQEVPDCMQGGGGGGRPSTGPAHPAGFATPDCMASRHQAAMFVVNG